MVAFIERWPLHTEDCRLVVSKAQNLRNAYQNISIHLNKQFYSSNWPITTILHLQPDNQPAILCSIERWSLNIKHPR